MIKVTKLVFNPFQVNTFVLHDETKECAIIDAGCNDEAEYEELVHFIESEGLTPVKLLNTHCHIDHIAGNAFVSKKYGLELEAHEAGNRFIEHSTQSSEVFGLDIGETVFPGTYLDEGDRVIFGGSALDVIYTPGHADGSICFVSHDDRFVVTGDVLFYQSIGRTDLPTGNYTLLLQKIAEKLLALDDDYTVYCGHGPDTSIGFERRSNPFLVNL